MNAVPRQKLQQIITKYGRTICDDPKRCEALLRDLCPDAKREVTLLIGALRENVAKELLNHSSSSPIEVLLNRQVQRLYDHLGMAEEFALWAVESWMLALGVIASPLPEQRKTVPPSRISAEIQPVRPSTKKMLPLQEFKFEIVKVDQQGNIIKREQKHAQQYLENLGNTLQLELVAIPGGAFLMGDTAHAYPQHRVTVDAFYIGKYPITQAQWQSVMGNNPSEFKGNGNDWHRKKPVENISWFDAVKFCKQLSSVTGHEYRLPSSAEWEYACRAGTTTSFYFGETLTGKLANFNDKGTMEETCPVGRFPPNTFGLYDMHGNVEEWCQDDWHNNYEGAPTDGSAWITEESAYIGVIRGGGWSSDVLRCHSGIPCPEARPERSHSVGVRVVLSV